MASDVLKKLDGYPNEEFHSSGKGEALRWLMDLNVAHVLPRDYETKPFVGASDVCPTHWIVAIATGDSNGLYVSCLPRSAISGEALKAWLKLRISGRVVEDRPPQ